jgi:WD repeat-containing protein 68
VQVQIVSLDEESAEFTAKSTFDHPYPTTKLMWIPDTVSQCFTTGMIIKY